MILNPISIATSGVYANNINLGLASFGYIDIAGGATVITIGAYKGLYLGLYAKIYEVGRI